MVIRRFFLVPAFLVLAAGPALSGGPRITFEKEVLDYGKVRYGATVTEDFVFSNTGDQTLVIEKLRSSCGCTKAVKGSSEVPPNGKSNIGASFDTTDMKSGKKEQKIYVHSNDPERPILTLRIQADVIKDLEVDPPFIVKHLPHFEESVSFPLKISNLADKTFTIRGVKTEAAGLQASLNPAGFTVAPRSTVPFTLSLKLGNEPDRSYYGGQVHLESDHPNEGEISLGYSIELDQAK